MRLSYTLADLHADADLRGREFPITRSQTYLGHAGVCPLPARVVEAMSVFLGRCTVTGQFEYLFRDAEEQARVLTAQLLGADQNEIAFVPSTSAGLGMVASGLSWQPGDEVIIPDNDFPANMYPWLALKSRGVAVRRVPRGADGSIDPQAVLGAVTPHTRLVALASVHYATGAPLAVDDIGKGLRDRGVLFCVDAIQSLGALPTSTRYVDFLTADGHKWLLGPQGMGILYVRREAMDLLSPALLGWRSVVNHRDFDTLDPTLAPSGRRYEPGSLNAVGVMGLHAALELLCGLGIDEIAAHLTALRDHAWDGLRAKGYEVIGPDMGTVSGIISFRKDHADMLALHRSLDVKGIITSFRSDPQGRPILRISPHLYTLQGDIDRLLDELE